jgi:DNA primase
VLAIAEEMGAENASYPLKLLISEKGLQMITTGKDPETGKHTAIENHVEGPTMVFSSTTVAVEPELLNRFLEQYIDESEEQTARILVFQRFLKTLEGKRYKKRSQQIEKLHQNVQRLLKNVEIYNPYSNELKFSATTDLARRNQVKYLTLIEAIAFLHQYQRPLKKDPEFGGEYIEVTIDDIKLANEMAGELLGNSLDELPPQTRYVLEQSYKMLQKICKEQNAPQSCIHFTRRQLREFTGMGDTQLKIHLHRLVDFEYLVIRKSRHGLFAYELMYNGEGRNGSRFFMGLIDVKELRKKK